MIALKLNTGVQIPALGLGTWQIPQGKKAEDAVLFALQAGYRHIDTAAIYGNEQSVGNAIKKSGIPRKELFVTTKLWNDDHDDPRGALTESLRKLQLEYVDLYLIHFPVPQRLKTWKVLEHLSEKGLCRSIGVSNFTIRHLQELLTGAKIVPAVNQVEFSPFLYQRGLLEFCSGQGIVLEAYSPLTHGKKLNDVRLASIAQRYGKSPAQLLLRWALQHSLVVLPKSSRKERIEENAQIFDFEISLQDMQQLDGLNEDLRVCWDPTDAP